MILYRLSLDIRFPNDCLAGLPGEYDKVSNMTMKYKTDDLRITGLQEVLAPKDLLSDVKVSDNGRKTIFDTRQAIHNILAGQDDRVLVIVGPCSVHDPKAAIEYAKLLKQQRDLHKKDLLIVMRVYFEKPRTTIGWKGLINDPNLDNSYEINKGLHIARQLLANINDLGVPAGTEFLDLITPQYLADLISWGAIGARTTESQVHRELASGLSSPVGFKNGTDGTLKVAVDALTSASQPHSFLSLTKDGHSAIFTTTGNNDVHVILRGGKVPNYDAKHVNIAAKELRNAGLPEKIMIDASHANSEKQFQRQIAVAENIAEQIANGDTRIMGVMLESHLVEGRQNVENIDDLTYGQSITDACISWDSTVPILQKLADAVQQRRKK